MESANYYYYYYYLYKYILQEADMVQKTSIQMFVAAKRHYLIARIICPCISPYDSIMQLGNCKALLRL